MLTSHVGSGLVRVGLGFFFCLFFKPGEDEDAGRLMQEAKGFRKSMLVTQLREETICGSIGEAA